MTPHAPRYPSRRSGDAVLALALVAVVGLSVASMFGVTPDSIRAAVAPEAMYGPVTGYEFAEFLRDNEARLREISRNFDDQLMHALEVGDKPIVDALRERYPEPSPAGGVAE